MRLNRWWDREGRANIPGSLIANLRYPMPTARKLFRANACGLRPGRQFLISSSIAAATRDKHAERTASSNSAWPRARTKTSRERVGLQSDRVQRELDHKGCEQGRAKTTIEHMRVPEEPAHSSIASALPSFRFFLNTKSHSVMCGQLGQVSIAFVACESRDNVLGSTHRALI